MAKLDKFMDQECEIFFFIPFKFRLKYIVFAIFMLNIANIVLVINFYLNELVSDLN